jgi:thiopurine S-methyltransferase
VPARSADRFELAGRLDLCLSSGMKSEYWIGRWERGETGFHQAEAESELVARFTNLATTRILVPLCGKSLDLTWLASRAYFEEGKIDFTEERAGKFTVFKGGKVTLFNGDFFDFSHELAGNFGAVYDRAALIALPPELRARYAAHLIGLIRGGARPGFTFLQLVIERGNDDGKGPPFSVSGDEINRLYGKEFEIMRLKSEQLDIGAQCVYELSPLHFGK